MEIIEERVKRNCESAVTKYSLLYHKKVAKSEKPNGLVGKGLKFKSQSYLNAAQKRFPIYHPVKRESDSYLNGAVQYAYTPITMVLIEQKKEENKNNMNAVMEKRIADVAPLLKQERTKTERIKTSDDGFKWPGVHEVMEAYHRYARGKRSVAIAQFFVSLLSERTLETDGLRQRCTMLSEQVQLRQAESKYLERKRRELRASSFLLEQERLRLQKCVDGMTKLVDSFR